MPAFGAANPANHPPRDESPCNRTRPTSITAFESACLAASIFNILVIFLHLWVTKEDGGAWEEPWHRLLSDTLAGLVVFPFVAIPYFLSLAMARARSALATICFYGGTFCVSVFVLLAKILEIRSTRLTDDLAIEALFLCFAISCLHTPSARRWMRQDFADLPEDSDQPPTPHPAELQAGALRHAETRPREWSAAERLCLAASGLNALAAFAVTWVPLRHEPWASSTLGDSLTFAFAELVFLVLMSPVIAGPFWLVLAASRLRSTIAAFCLAAYAVSFILIATNIAINCGTFNPSTMYATGQAALTSVASFLLYKEFVWRMSAA